jgi:hypothetical protein
MLGQHVLKYSASIYLAFHLGRRAERISSAPFLLWRKCKRAEFAIRPSELKAEYDYKSGGDLPHKKATCYAPARKPVCPVFAAITSIW